MAYRFAAEHPEVMSYVPCFCGCQQAGHKGNTDCFVHSRAANGDVVEWEEHGVDVPVRGLATTDELKEVLLNVLENARHAAAKRVAVAVSVDGGGPDDRRVVISVSDDGHGISPDVLPRVFEPHFSTRTSGSGLGLAISRQLVEGWGGEISLQSAEGAGTEVQIRLRATPTSTS